MKSKSPLNAYKYNMTGAYANPQTVIQPILGAEVAKSVIGAASKLGSQLITKEVGSKAAKQALASKNFSDMAKSGQEESNKIQHSKVGGEGIFKNDSSLKGMIGAGKPEIGKFSFLTSGENPITLKGSPVKHNTGAAEAGELAARQNNPFARMLKSNNVQQKLDAAKSQPRNFAGVIAQAISDQGGSAAGSIGQQIGNQAQQRAADAGGSTGVDPFLPPPNQVAETGSYGGGGDRILEMDSNPVGNQSIGRDTDVASQLFGSGQRASMLAMKGFAKTEEELIDETKFEELPKENTMGYNVQDITSIKTDKKGREYMVDIETKKDTIRPAQGDIKFPRLKSKNKGRTFNR
jgi:hypothetical protein